MAEITTIISKEAAAPGPKTSAANHTAWLEQLESAQWQQRLRYQPQADQRQPGRPGTAQQEPGPAAARARGVIDATRHTHASGRVESGPHAGETHVRAAGGTAGPVPAAAESRPVFGSGLPLLQQTPLGAAAREVRALWQLRRMAAIDWQAQNAHVMAGEQGVRMWLRDARYEKSDGYRLLLELRARFASMGFRLAEFTLNGERVAVSAVSDQAGEQEKARE